MRKVEWTAQPTRTNAPSKIVSPAHTAPVILGQDIRGDFFGRDGLPAPAYRHTWNKALMPML
jgi:hypothetical protein